MPSFHCRHLHAIFLCTSPYSFRTSLFPVRFFVSQSPEPFTGPEKTFIGPIDALRNERDLKKVVVKFKSLCSDKNVRRCSHIYYGIVRRFTAAKQFSLIEEILEDQKQYISLAKESFVCRIISLYGISSMFDNARKLFDEIPNLNCNRTVKSFNSLLAACLSSKNHDKIDEIFREIPLKLSITPNLGTYNTVLKAYLETGSLDSLLSTVEMMERNGVKPDSVTHSLVLDGLYKNGRVAEGDNVWNSMKMKGIKPCIHCYNSKLKLFVSQKKMDEAVHLFKKLVFMGHIPNAYTFDALFKGFREVNNLVEAKRMYKTLLTYNCHGNPSIYETLVTFATEMGDFTFALELSRTAMDQWCFLNEATLQTLLNGLVKESKVEEATKLMDLIQGSNGSYGFQLKLPSMEEH